jgi:hypothetical protein
MFEQAPLVNEKQSYDKEQSPAVPSQKRPKGGSIQKQTSFVNQRECDGMLSSKIVYSTQMTHYWTLSPYTHL